MEEHRVHGGSSVHLTLRILQPSQARLPILRRGRVDMASFLSLQRVDPLAGLFRGEQARQHASTVQRRNPRIYCVIPAGRPYVASELPLPASRVSLAMS